MKITALLFAACISISAWSQGNGYLGISMEKATNQGVRISEILENGAAQTYELKQNDIIYSINGVSVNSATELKKQIVSKDWGEKIKVVFARDGHTLTKLVTLGNRAEKVTYHVKRRKINSSYEWNFDENTWITVVAGKATKMVKLRADKSKDVLNITEGMDIPQEFSDLDDKLEIIEAIDARNAGKRFYPFITVYIKTYTSKSNDKTVTPTKLKVELKAFPNPSLGQFQFTIKTEKAKSKSVVWQVIDISGKLIKEGNVADFEGATTQSMDLTQQGAGVYLLKVVYDNQVFTERLVVK